MAKRTGTGARAIRARRQLSSYTGLAVRVRVYQVGESLEIDDVDHYQIVRKRVFFDDVLLITLHEYRGVGFLLTTGVCTAFLLSIALVFAAIERMGIAAMVTLGFAAPFAIFFLLRLILPARAVTVYGKRSRADMSWWLNRRKPQAVFDALTRRVQAVQAALARKLAAEATPAVVDPPPAPPA